MVDLVNFPIYQSAGVTDEQAETATQTIKDAYSGLGAMYKSRLAGANVEIWIVPPGGYSVPQKDESGKIIGRLLYTASQAGIRSWFQNNIIPLVPKNQTATIALEFGTYNYTATVTGYFSNTEWDGIPEKTENTLESASTAGTAPQRGNFRTVFGRDGGITIMVEKTSEYNSYKVIDGEFSTLYLNYGYLMSTTDTELQEKIITAVTAMRNNEAKTE
jgi:hypothetical protein